MPLQNGQDKKGAFYRWGNKGKKYYYKSNDPKSRAAAKNKAKTQGRAVEASVTRGKK